MFGKKKFPSMPEAPSEESMLEDLKNSSTDDPVFRFTFEDAATQNGSRISGFNSSDDNIVGELSETPTAEEAYEMVKAFVEQNCEMNVLLGVLPAKCEQLKNSSSDLNHRLKSSKEFLNQSL
ncbi:hypothetical protein CHUAL_006076 [Chamberlinius hualienensis]